MAKLPIPFEPISVRPRYGGWTASYAGPLSRAREGSLQSLRLAAKLTNLTQVPGA